MRGFFVGLMLDPFEEGVEFSLESPLIFRHLEEVVEFVPFSWEHPLLGFPLLRRGLNAHGLSRWVYRPLVEVDVVMRLRLPVSFLKLAGEDSILGFGEMRHDVGFSFHFGFKMEYLVRLGCELGSEVVS